MSEKIKPAMPPEEWKAQLNRSSEDRRRVLLHAKDEADADGYLTIHGLAALALHGQPFGFTWEDVDALRWAAGFAVGTSVTTDYTREKSARLSYLADRIAALLPPR